MTRRTFNADGTLTLKSFSCFGEGNVAETFRQEVAPIDAHNRKARAIWRSLPPDERERRMAEFEAQKVAQRFATGEAWRAACPEPDDGQDGGGPTFI